MKIVLIQPPSPFLLIDKWDLPLSLLYLKGFLQKKGHAVRIVHPSGEDDYLKQIPLDGDIYGVTVFTPQHEISIEIGKHLREQTEAVLVAGGNHVTAIPQEFLLQSDFDIVVRGEGEFTLNDICSGKALVEIDGISYKDKGKIVHAPDRSFCKNIDEIPFPRFDSIDLREYGNAFIDQPHSTYSVDIMTSRGGPQACSFCASSQFWKRKIRFHSVKYILEYIDYLYKEGINDFIFADDNFCLSYTRLDKICLKLQSLQSRWMCTTRSDCVTPELADLLKRSGCQKVSLGIESGSDEVLELVNKNTTVRDHEKAVRILKKAGLQVTAFLIVGLPGENLKTEHDTIRFIREQPIDFYTISTFVPYPGTPIWTNPERYNYQLDKSRPYREYCTLGKELNLKSVSMDYFRVNEFREMLINACSEKCTNLRSFEIANVRLKNRSLGKNLFSRTV